MEDVELHTVRVFLGEQRMDVAVLDHGQKRVIQYSWLARGTDPSPPASWWQAVCGEIEWQRTQEAKTKDGTSIPNF